MHVYASPESLIADLGKLVIDPAETKVREQRPAVVEASGTELPIR